MTDSTTSEKLGITAGSVVWVVADSVEETALLDPLPPGVETVDEPIDGMDAAVLVADDRDGLSEHLDEVLPALGSTPVAWISFPTGRSRGLDRDTLLTLVEEYGWGLGPEVRLDETWTAVRLRQL